MATNVLRAFDTVLGERPVNLQGPLTGGTPTTVGVATLTATTDPGVSNDSSTGIGVGAIWFNSSAGFLRWWECRDASVGAAKWVFSGADYTNGGTNPATEATMFGTGTSIIAAEGNINRQISLTGINPGGTAADNVLAAYTLPANSFDIAGRGISITAQGSFVSNTNSKTIKIIFNATTATVGSTVTGGTTVASLANATTLGSGGWTISANIFKAGAAGANTQIALHQINQSGSVAATLVAPTTNLTATESGAIIIAITGNAATTASDIVFNFLEVNAMN